jgi:hypothetical protein
MTDRVEFLTRAAVAMAAQAVRQQPVVFRAADAGPRRYPEQTPASGPIAAQAGVRRDQSLDCRIGDDEDEFGIIDRR